MSGSELATILVSAAGGAFAAIVLAAVALRRAPVRLVRTNVNGMRVPAVLGVPVVLAGLIPLCVGAIVGDNARVALSFSLIGVVLATAGLWDDLRGDELPRGFSGHLEAVRTGRLTGGLVKLIAGGLVGLGAGILLADGIAEIVRVGVSVALSANLINLLDRAPGRAGKAVLIVGVPMLALGQVGWAIAAAGSFGSLAAVLPIDLRERGMLGDAGANALGGVLGLGLALSLPPGIGWGVCALLAVLNVASEKISFSRVIEGNRLLKKIDLAGRKEST